MTYTIFSLEFFSNDSRILANIEEEHRGLAMAKNSPSYTYKLWHNALSVSPTFQESESDYLFGFNALLNNRFAPLLNPTEVSHIADIALRLDIFHDEQCNLEFGADFVCRLAYYPNLSILISCYENAPLVAEKQNRLKKFGIA